MHLKHKLRILLCKAVPRLVLPRYVYFSRDQKQNLLSKL
jgi:hypothetical protein